MRLRYKLTLSFTGILVIGSIIVLLAYFIYYKISSETTLIVESPFSINYAQTSKINEYNYKDVTFSVTNDSEEESYYYISFINSFSGAEIPYELQNKNKVVAQGILKDQDILTFVELSPFETHNYTLNFYPKHKDIFKTEIIVKKEKNQNNTFADVILKHNTILNDPITKVAEEISFSNEGLIIDNDPDGYTYYFRGLTENNYVYFAEKTWRIVRINGDGTTKLVLDNIIEEALSSYSKTNSKIFAESDILKYLNNWYLENLNKYDDLIIANNYCHDNSTIDNDYAGYDRAKTSYIATFSCLGEEVNSKIGLLTIDEMLYAGYSTKKVNDETYLYIKNQKEEYYLMTPAKTSNNSLVLFTINTNNKISDTVTADLYRAIRPAINISKNALVGGTGTETDPYIIKGLIE